MARIDGCELSSGADASGAQHSHQQGGQVDAVDEAVGGAGLCEDGLAGGGLRAKATWSHNGPVLNNEMELIKTTP